jgi:hypothetical protein
MRAFPQWFGTAAQRLEADEIETLRSLAGVDDNDHAPRRLGPRRWTGAVVRLREKGDIISFENVLRLTRSGWARIDEPLSDTDVATLRWVEGLGVGARFFEGPLSDRMKSLGLVADKRGLTAAGRAVLSDEPDLRA